MSDISQFIGNVQNNQLRLLWPKSYLGQSVRMTAAQIQEAISPEAKEIIPGDYEGQAIMIQGRLDSDWIYSASVIDQAGPILTVIVRSLFAAEEK